MIEQFRVEISREVVTDFRDRLRAARWPSGVTDSGGVSLKDVRGVARYAIEEFDWPAQESAMNQLPHFRAECGGSRLHYIHVRSSKPDAAPLLLLHGWPGSFVEMLSVAPLLTESFHLVIPSLPGYGFSDPPTSGGMSNARIAELLAEHMSALGYDRFAVQGGDWGAGIATWLAVKYPSRVIGIHLNYIPGSYEPCVDGDLSAEEAAFLSERARWIEDSGAYGHVQRTRPLTLAYGLSDSPIGLLAWIVEKFYEWADPLTPIPLDTILANVLIYWATNTIASSMRLYLESAHMPLRFARGEHIAVPCGIARFPREAPFPPRMWIERAYNVVHWTNMPRGGHFAALEAPELFAADVKEFFGDRRLA